MSLPDRWSAPAGAILLNGSNHPACELLTTEGDEYLVDDNIIEYWITSSTQPFSHAMSITAGSFNEIHQT
jgi:hypothetical protein